MLGSYIILALSRPHLRTPMPEPYHHGDLRRALLDEAAVVLRESGVGALSLRDLARRVGVSTAAPYHHFENKATLLGAIAADALAALDSALAAAAEGTADPAARLHALGVAYVAFAVGHPERFRLTFRPELGSPVGWGGLAAGGAPEETPAFRHLWAAVREAGDPEEAALAAWGLAHGLASLFVDGPLQPLAEDPERVRAVAGAALQHVVIGGGGADGE